MSRSRISSRTRHPKRSGFLFLMILWTFCSIIKEHTYVYNNNSSQNRINHLSIVKPILLVEAAWYSEICHAGPRYKVRIDPVSGNVVPVYPEGYVPILSSNSFGSNNDHNTDASAANDDQKTSSLDNPVDDMLIDASRIQNSNETNTESGINDFLDSKSTPESQSIDNNRNFGGDTRSLRTNRLWRDFDEDSETDAIVLRTHNNDDKLVRMPTANEKEKGKENVYRQQAETSPQIRRSLFLGDSFEDDLEPGEFYVKPCICQDSRWTFPRDAGFEQTTITLPPTDLNATDTSNWTPNDRYTIFPPTPENSPNNFGLLPNNQLTYVQDGTPDGDLYLCRAQAMYCGVLVDMDSDTAPIVKCYDQNMRHIIARNAWPLILLWYFGLAIICCCTVHGRTAGDYVQDRLTYFFKKFVCCFWDLEYDFNDRMLNRMIRDDERERRRRRGYSRNGEADDDDDSVVHPWYFSNQRLQFERSLMAQVQWIWRHQEYMREINLREEGLPPPQLKLKVKRFRMETSTSNSKEGGFSNTSPPTSVTTSSSKEDSSLKQQKGSVFASIGQRLSADNGNCTRQGNGASTTTTVDNESTCSSSSAENILVNAENSCCRVCPGDKNRKTHEQYPAQGMEEEGEFVTLDLGPEVQNDEDEKCNISSVHDSEDLDSLDAPTCAICFCAFEEGDRIGNLTCKHEFHIDCLKGWVQRKNACPLCNVRLGTPERPLPPRDENNNHESSIDGSRHSLSNMIHWLRNGGNNNGNAGGAGEIHVGSRMGMIGAVSAAADINAARERVVRRGDRNR